MIGLGKGKVYLVGAGPGDPKLITVRGLEALKKSDVIVYDRLASPRLLRQAKLGATKLYVGKRTDRHTLPQDEINQLLVDLALEGKIVTRLKGGDPSVFGRVGEEAALLVDHGIEFEIIPGITSSIAVPAYAGIPVTHRDYNASFSVITGHEQPDKLDSTINWKKLAEATETLVFLMGVAKIKYISEQLVRNGKSEDTPVALIRWGSTAKQQTLTGTLKTIAKKVEEANFKPPAIILVGEVVKLREKLQWYEKKPLFGKRILVTRSRSQASLLSDLIDDLGGEAIEFPMIELRFPTDETKLSVMDAALHSLAQYDWVIFTSVNGVEYFFRRMKELQVDIRSMHRASITAVGPETAEALRERGLTVQVIPDTYQAEGIWESLQSLISTGQKVLLPRSDLARSFLPERLQEAGLHVDDVVVYETCIMEEGTDELIAELEKQELDIITFTSSSTVRNLVQIIQRQQRDHVKLLQHASIACIGPVTAQTAEEFGLTVNYLAEESTIPALVKAILKEEQQ